MAHEATLIATIAIGLVLAAALGFLASKLRLPPLVGYLLAGIAIGPFTPGFVADGALAAQLAEVGVILLMFGVGLHFSAADLVAVRRIAVPGAVGQIILATALGAGISMAWGWSFAGGLVLGLALSVASTVVLLRALDEQGSVETVNGRIAVGWLIVEDLAMVLTLVLLPAVAETLGTTTAVPHGAEPGGDFLTRFAVTIAKVAAFVAVALVVGPRVVPWLLRQVARTGSRELFTLTVLAAALGIAYGSAQLFGVSFALGAFFAGVILSESELSQRAAEESLPLQDAFAVLFFVSVGMLFDPSILIREPGAVIVVLLVILVGKSIAAFSIVLLLGFPLSTALTVSASLAQIGEFSFILAGLGIVLGMMPPEGRDLILAGALLSITLNPLAFAAVSQLTTWLNGKPGLYRTLERSRRGQLLGLEREFREVRRRAEAKRPNLGLPTAELVQTFPMFASLSSGQREELYSLFRPRAAEPGERIIRVGDPADAVFFISSGAVEVDVGARKIRLGPGDFFGEMALLQGGPRTADVTALDYCQLLALDERDFRRFMARHPDLRARFDEVAQRRGEMNRELTTVAPPG